jgi:hypothetical protein
VVQAEPKARQTLNPSIPQDLETICLKRLEKKSSRRYHSGEELAEELERFSCDETLLGVCVKDFLAAPVSVHRRL